VFFKEFEIKLESPDGVDKEGILLMNITGTWSSVLWTDDITMRTVCKLLGYG